MLRVTTLLLLLVRVAVADVSMSIPDTTIARGADFSAVPVYIHGVEGQGVVAIDLKVRYDSTVVDVDVLPLAIGSALSGEWNEQVHTGWMYAYNVIADTILFATATALDTIKNDGPICWLYFTPKDSSTPLFGMFHIIANINEIPCPIDNHGSVTLSGGSAQLAVTRVIQGRRSALGWQDTLRVSLVDSDVQEPRAHVVGRQDREWVAGGIVPYTTDPTGWYDGLLTVDGNSEDVLVVEYTDSLDSSGQMVVLRDTTYVVPLVGDVTGNLVYSAYDAGLTLRYAVGMDKPTPTQVRAADVDGNGSVTAHDAYMVLRLILQSLDHWSGLND